MKDKNYVIENISDAFLALRDIDDSEVASMIKPRRRVVEGRSYSVNASNDELEDAKSYLHDAVKEATALQVIDPDADTIEHIKNKESYVGQAILQCERCGAKRFIDLDKLAVDENNPDLFNVEDECPNCKSAGDGYELIGQVGKVASAEPTPETSAEETPAAEVAEEPVEEVAEEEVVEEEPAAEAEPEKEYQAIEEEPVEDNTLEEEPEEELTDEEKDAFALPEFEDAEEQNESYEEDNANELNALRDRDDQGLNNDMAPSEEEKEEYKPKLKLKFKDALKEALEEADLIEATHNSMSKPEGDKTKSFNNALKYAKRDNVPYIYGYTNAARDGKFFALDQPIKCDDMSACEKEFRKKYRVAGTMYVAYPNKKFIEEGIKVLKEDIEVLFDNDMAVASDEAAFENNNRPFSNIEGAARDVMAAYQTANKWLDTVKEAIYTDMNCPFFSSFIHELAHTMPGRFDKFGDILHTINMPVPYPETDELANPPKNLEEAFNVTFNVLNDIKAALNEFIKVTDEDYHGMSCAAEACLNDIEGEYPMLYRMQAKAKECNDDTVSFDKFVGQYVEHKGNLLESLNEGKKNSKYGHMTFPAGNPAANAAAFNHDAGSDFGGSEGGECCGESLEDDSDVPYFADIEEEVDDDVDHSFFKDIIREANDRVTKWAEKAYMLGQIIQCMNDEEAYYGGWLYIWPDGDIHNVEDAALYFNTKEDYEELEDSFKRKYKAYHSGGLFEAPEEVEEAAHEWDRELGLAPIENIRMKHPVHEDVEEEDEENNNEPIMIADLLDCVIDPENIGNIEIVDNGETLFSGVLEDMPEEMYEKEFVSFNVAESKLNVNVDEDEESDDILADFLDMFDDEETDQIVLTDVGSSEAIFEGTKEECLDKFGDKIFVSIEAPEYLVINVSAPVDGGEDNNVDESLFESICKVNHLASYRVNKVGSAEYWINESLNSKDEFDLKTVYEGYVRGYGKELETKFKRETGYREMVVEQLDEAKEVCPDCGKEVCECNTPVAEEVAGAGKPFVVKHENGKFISPEMNVGSYSRAARFASREDAENFIADGGDDSWEKHFQVIDTRKDEAYPNSFKTRQELAEAIANCKNNNTPFRVERSKNEGYRYDLIVGEAKEPVNEVAPLVAAAVTAAAGAAASTLTDRIADKFLGEGADDMMPVEYLGSEEAEEYTGPIEIIDAPDAPSTTAVTPADMSDVEVEIMQKISRVANDISNALRDAYGIEAEPALIVADILQDLKLIGGQIDVRDLEDTPINRATAQMFNDYNATYELVDQIMSELTGEEIRSTPEVKLGQAIAALDSPAFSTPAIQQGINSTRFLQAARHGAVPYISAADLPMLESFAEPDAVDFDESLFDESLNDYLAEAYHNDVFYHTMEGSVNEKGVITLKGLLEGCSFERTVTFTLSPKETLTEELQTMQDVVKAIGEKDFLVKNDLTEETFEYTFSNKDNPTEVAPSIFAEGRTACDVIKEFNKENGKEAFFPNKLEKMDCVANWEYINHLDFYLEHGADVCNIKNNLLSSSCLEEGLENRRVIKEFFWPGLLEWMAVAKWAEANDVAAEDLIAEDAPSIARDMMESDPEGIWGLTDYGYKTSEEVIEAIKKGFDSRDQARAIRG